MDGSLSHGNSRTIDKENTRMICAFLHRELIISNQLKQTQCLQYTVRSNTKFVLHTVSFVSPFLPNEKQFSIMYFNKTIQSPLRKNLL